MFYTLILFLFLFNSLIFTSSFFVHFNEDKTDNLPTTGSSESWSSIELEVAIDFNQTLVKIDGNTIYSHKSNFSNASRFDVDEKSGIHWILLHQTTFKVLGSGIFYTAQPSSDQQLLRKLMNVHDGRVVILIGSVNFSFWFRKTAEEFFYDFGTVLGPRVALGEPWTLIFHKGFSKWKDYELDADYWEESPHEGEDALRWIELLNRNRTRTKKEKGKEYRIKTVSPDAHRSDPGSYFSERERDKGRRDRTIGRFRILYESITTVKNYLRSKASPIKYVINIKSEPEPNCRWHADKSLQDLTKFCSLYDGYKPFCRCKNRVPLLPKFGPSLNDEDYAPIPVAIVTAQRLPQVLRQVRQLRAAADGGSVPIWICVDGANSEAKHLSRLIGVPAIFHNNKYSKGTRDRVNSHVGWSLNKLVELNRNANYFIVLEDDLDLAPDFIRYFQQISWLMDVDQTIKVANAYNYNSFPHTSIDPSRIFLVQSYPYYGWMMRRADAVKMLEMWPTPNKEADWDLFMHYYYLNESFVVIPEIPRTKHIGGGGVHVSGYVQETTYNLRPLNKKPEVKLQLRRHWSRAYSLDLMKFALTASVLNVTEGPCSHPPLTTEKPGGKYVLYLNLSGDSDEASSYATIAQCLGFYEESMMEQLDGTMLRRYFYNEILLIACPVSPYCHIDEESPLIYTPSEEAKSEAEEMPFITMHTAVVNMRRNEPIDVFDEISLTNYNIFEIFINE